MQHIFNTDVDKSSSWHSVKVIIGNVHENPELFITKEDFIL